MPIGRPTDYNMELLDAICERIARGESMRSICRDKSMPAMRTMFRWLREKPEFRQQYIYAKEESADLWAEDIVEIADNESSQPVLVDGVPLVGHDGEIVQTVTPSSVAHARLRTDCRKWAASKLKPKKYGERITTEHQGGLQLTDMTEQQLDVKVKALLNATES